MARSLSTSSKKLMFCGSLITLCVIVFGILLSTLFKSVSTNVSQPVPDFVIAVCRHGSRSPLFFYQTDPYNDPKYWPEGIKATLTNKGKLEVYQLGKNLRKRYNKLFQEGYKQEDIYVRSTQVSRTYMSAAILLAGMFPPSGKEVWNADLNWQPVPIWPDTSDKTEIVTNKSVCAKFTEMQQEAKIEAGWYLEKHKDLFDYIIKHSHSDIKLIDDYIQVWDPISCEVALGLTLPAWTNSIYSDEMVDAASFMFKVMINTREMNRLVIGPLLKDFNSWINRRMNGQVTEKMLLHSGHDFTILGLLSAVGFTNIRTVKPAASLMIEFHRLPEGQIVKMFYANDSSAITEPMQLDMPNCRDPCSLNEFLKLTKEMETGDWKSECNL